MKSSLTPLTSRLISSGDTRQQNAESGVSPTQRTDYRLPELVFYLPCEIKN